MCLVHPHVINQLRDCLSVPKAAAGIALRWPCALLLVAVTAATACRAPRPDVAPAIEFTRVPTSGVGGSERLARIAGRAIGARPGQRIVLFAKSGVWWVQPLTLQPFTNIESDATWKNEIHLGEEYAALLVDPGYQPPHTTESLPARGGNVIAVATVKGAGDVPARPRKSLTFSGYEWDVRDIPSDRGGANDYDRDNAWVGAGGALHLKLVQRDGRWTSAEVILTRALGYGTYVFTVRDTSRLDPAAALGMLTWDDGAADQNHRELDIEVSQWGDDRIPNGQFVLQPYYVPANVARFKVPSGIVTHSFRWEPGRARFRSVRGTSTTGPLVARHEFTSGVPTPGAERVRMNLYFFRFSPRSPQSDVEVVIERFQHLP
jgi:hypothetical protein